MTVRVTYFINQYPKVSHAFIRREILALERQGVEVQRIALRGWDAEVVDEIDEQERARTAYVLKDGLLALTGSVLTVLITSPLRFLSAFVLAFRMGWRGDRPLPYHLISLAEACRFLPWMKSFGADHLHAHFGTNSAEIAMLAHELGGPPYSFTVHGPEEFDKPQFLGIAQKVHRAAFVVAITSFAQSQLYRWIAHADWTKIKVVHCGLEPEFHEIEAPAVAAPRLVCIGRICAEKGQLLLVDAARQLTLKGVPYELVIVGDGDMRGRVEALIKKYGLEKQVRLTGSISTDRLREEILAARALVLPTFAEGLPMVIMEAMALRRPVLTTYVAGIPELLQSNVNSWLFPAGSIESLTDAMENCLSTSVEVLRTMGNAAHARVLERHSIDVEAVKLAALFRHSATGLT